MRPPSRLALAALALLGAGCANLDDIASLVCGNSVIDSGEDCDSHVEHPGTSCGKPLTSTACRYECTAGSGAKCPDGWGCGQDGICRHPSGGFTRAQSVDGVVRAITAANFDGDGRPSLITLSDIDALGRRTATLVDPDDRAPASQVPAQVFSPSVADLDGDGSADVAFADLLGVAVLRGNAQHASDFVSYPTALLPAGIALRTLLMDVLPAQPGDELMVLVDDHGGHLSLMRPTDQKAKLTTILDLPPGRLAGRAQWAQLDERPGSPCPEIVLAFEGLTTVTVFSPCRAAGKNPAWSEVAWNDGGKPSTVSLPDGVTVDAGVLLADVDGDGHVDILIGANKQTLVAYGNGDGTFHTQGGKPGFAGPSPIDAPLPLAVADLNGDGLIDYVVPQGIVASKPTGYGLVYTNVAASWTEAVIADFNRDGQLDVIGGSTAELNLQFLGNAGWGAGGATVFNLASVSTVGPPASLVVGDFDGDLVNDVAFTEHGASGDSWTVAFGSPAGAPTALRRMGRLDRITQLTAARLPDGPAAGVASDGLSDLVMVSESTTGQDTLVFALGRGERVMLAPFALRSGPIEDQPLSVTTGRFFGGARPTLAAVGKDPPVKAADGTKLAATLRLWHLDPAADSLRDGVELPAFLSAEEGAFRFGVHTASGEIDGVGLGDAVVISGPYGTLTQSALVVARADAVTQKFVVGAPLPFDAQSTLFSPLLLADLGGDGRLAAIFKPNDATPGPIMVFLQDGKGGFDTTNPVLFKPDGGATDFACIHAGAICQLHVIGPGGVFVLTLDATLRVPTLTQLAGLPGGHALAAGDFDGDGLEDLAIGSDTGTLLYASTPVLK